MLWVIILASYNTLMLKSHVCIVLLCFINENIHDYVSDEYCRG